MLFYQQHTQFSKHQNNCPNNWRMISDNDVQEHGQELLKYFEDSIWINVTVRYTPWVIDKGIYNYNFSSDIIGESSVRNRETLFIECCLFCSSYGWSHIGLQETKCYCLLLSALTNENSAQYYSSTPCVQGYIPRCPKVTNGFEVALFERDKDTYQGLDECLAAKVDNTYLSISSTQCNSSNKALCLVKNDGGYYKEGASISRHQTVGYCKHFQGYDVDFKTVNSTINKAILNDGLYWMNNFRESYVLMPDLARPLKSMCTTGKAVDGKIQMQTVECDKKTAYTLCTKESMDTPVIHGGSIPTMVIVAAVSVFILLSLTLISIVILIRFRKQRIHTSAQGPVYATVRKEMLHKGKAIYRGDHQEIPNAIIGEDNIYDHTDRTPRPPVQQTDASNYDTMESMQGTGESTYHHTITFKTSTDIIEGDESAYYHAANCKLETENEQHL